MSQVLPSPSECCQRCCPDETTALAGAGPTVFATIEILRAHLLHSDGAFAITTEGFSWWHFDALSLAFDDGTTVIKPDDLTDLQPGRWLVFT